jgi:hypothetical protein
MKKLLKYAGLLILPVAMFVSCDEESYPDTTQYLTQITSIKILNGGYTGTEVFEGVIDENKKTIVFPELMDLESDLTKLKFEITATDERAHLDSLEYNFVVAPGYSERTRTIKIVNSTRFREYYVTVKLDTPPVGGDFSKAKVYDFSPNVFKAGDYADGSVDMPIYNATNTYGRQYGISLNNVLIVDRVAAPGGPGLVPLPDIKQGKLDGIVRLGGIAEFQSLVSSAAWGTAGGVIRHGHIYISNGQPWNIGGWFLGHWNENDPTASPTIMRSTQEYIGRYDGVLSSDINASGKGSFYICANSAPPIENLIMRYNVSNFTTLNSTDFLAGETPRQGSWATFNKVPGASEYMFSGYNSSKAPVRLTDSKGAEKYALPIETFPATTAAVNIIAFNSERYLLVGNVSGKFDVYDITVGATTQEALEKMDTARPLFTYSIGPAPTDNASVTSDWIVDGDDTLYIVVGAAGGGFAVFEVPKKIKERN